MGSKSKFIATFKKVLDFGFNLIFKCFFNGPYFWALDFINKIKQAILINDHETIINYQKIYGHEKSVPTLEHFIPLIYILAMQEEGEKARIFAEGLKNGLN